MMDKKSLCKSNNIIDLAGKFLQHVVQSVPTEFAVRRVARIPDEVGDGLRHFPMRQHLLKFLPAALAIFALSACVSNEYMGIALKPDGATTDLQDIARRARDGDKQAQFELGIRFEEGKAVPRDAKRAIKLYRRAAADSGGFTWAYSPSPGNGAPGRVMRVDTGPRQAGLKEAAKRLAKITEFEDHAE